MVTEDLLQILPLASAIAWWGIGILPIARSRTVSPFERSITAFAFLIGAWAFLDWIFLGFRDPGQVALAIVVSNVRITVITFATFALLLAAKWINLGHSRYDGLLFLPVLGSVAIIWAPPGLTFDAELATWGMRLVRDPLLYTIWATQQVAYVAASTILISHLCVIRRGLTPQIRRRFLWLTGSLALVLLLWLTTNIYNNITQTAGVPWFSSLLVIPAAMILAATIPMTTEDVGEMLRALSAVQERVIAVYLFHRTGQPLVALASGRDLPIEAEQLEGVLAVVGNFVETSVPSSRGLQFTVMRYDRLGIVAVQGDFVIAAAVYDGPAYDTLRSELARVVRTFEERRWRDLGTWEDATRAAESAADQLSTFLYRPGQTAAPALAVRKKDGLPRETP